MVSYAPLLMDSNLDPCRDIKPPLRVKELSQGLEFSQNYLSYIVISG